jgi:hypothetical protein
MPLPTTNLLQVPNLLQTPNLLQETNLLIPGGTPPPTAPAIVTKSGFSENNTSVFGQSFSAAVGNALILFFSFGNSRNTPNVITSVVDANGNVFTQIPNCAAFKNRYNVDAWWCPNITVENVSITATADDTMSIFDGFSYQVSGASRTLADSKSITSDTDLSLELSSPDPALYIALCAAATVLGVAPPWTLDDTGNINSSGIGHLTSIGSQTAEFTSFFGSEPALSGIALKAA